MGRSYRNVMAIASKELRSSFASPVAWVMLGLFAVIFGYFFNTYLYYFVRQGMQSQFGPWPYGSELRVLTAPTYWDGFEHPGNIVLADGLAGE